jgi:carbon starvation protein CstA
MLQDLVAGSALVTLTVLIHTVGLIFVAGATPPVARRLGFHNHDIGRTLVMTGTVLSILAILTFEVWIWALAYVWLGATVNLADALYLSTAMFSTVGYGEIHIAPAWRLLTALEGINGFLLIGWSTAYLVGVATRHGPFRQGEHF